MKMRVSKQCRLLLVSALLLASGCSDTNSLVAPDVGSGYLAAAPDDRFQPGRVGTPGGKPSPSDAPNLGTLAVNAPDAAAIDLGGASVREISVLWAPGPDGPTGDDISTPDWPIRYMGWGSPPGDLWHALGIDLKPVDGGVAFTVSTDCLGSQWPSPNNNWNGGVGISFLDPGTGAARTVSLVSVEARNPPVTLRAYDGDGVLLGSESLSTSIGFLTVESEGIARADVTGSFWCIGHRIRYAFEGTAQPPVADAGADQMVEATSHLGTPVTLDGSRSYDPDGDIVSWVWLDETAAVIATGEIAQVALRVGVHTVTLRVTGQSGLTAEDEVEVTIRDTTPPELALAVTPDFLWPVNHRYRVITIGFAADDNGAAEPDLVLVAEVVSADPDNAAGTGDGDTTGDIRVTRPDGTFLLSSHESPTVIFDPRTDQLELRAERAATDGGRAYTIRVTATDPSGNDTVAIAVVAVPLNPVRVKP
jgi:hypothetical protein